MAGYQRRVQLKGKSAEELYATVSKEINRFFEKTGVGEQFRVTPDEAARTFQLEAKGVTATLYCRHEELHLQGELSFFLLPFKSKIDTGIDRWIQKTFGSLA